MILWITGMSGSGKTTLATEVVRLARQSSHESILLVDGDVLRDVWGDNLGFSVESRRKNMGRMARLCHYLEQQKTHAVAAVIAPFQETRNWNRKHLAAYYEVFITSPTDRLVARDPKGLYRRALAGKDEMPGINQPYEIPVNADLYIDNSGSLELLTAYAPSLAQLFVNAPLD